MRIVHVTDCYLPRLGGIELQVSGLAQRQHAAGHDVEVITSVSGGAGDGDVRVHRPAGPVDGRIRYGSSWPGALRAADGNVDALHVHLSTWSPLGFRAAQVGHRAGVPVAVTVHSMWNRMAPAWRAAARLVGWRDWPVAWSAVSEAAARPVATAVAPAHVSVLPNAVDPLEWALPATRHDPQRVVLASVLRLAPRKRPRALLRMLAALRRQVPAAIRLEAFLVGDGPQRSQLAGDLDALGIADWVRLTGALDRTAIRDLYRDVDVYVAPATLESFGIAALEARAAGLPVVAQVGTGIAEFVRHDVNGLLCDGDRAMIAALRGLAVEPEQRARIAAHNRAEPPDMTWDSVLADCERLYARAAALAGKTAAMSAAP